MNIELLEKELTAYFATMLGMTVSKEIYKGSIPNRTVFRGCFPPITTRNGVAFRVTSIETRNTVNPPVILAQILGKFEKREDALLLLEKLESSLPKYGESTAHFKMNYILKDGAEAPFTHGDHGATLYYASYHVRVAVLTLSQDNSN